MITPEILRQFPLFSPLPPELQAFIASRAADVRVKAGDTFVHEGETPAFFFLLEGSFEVFKQYGATVRSLAVREPGDYIGEIPILLGSPFIAGARALTPSRLLRLEAGNFRKLLHKLPEFQKAMLATLTQRIEGLQEEAAIEDEIPVIVGDNFDPRCHDLRDFLARNQRPFEWYDAADAPRCTRLTSVDLSELPVVRIPGGRVLVRPSLAQLADALGMLTRPTSDHYDVAVIGGGPAGLAAAVYGASEGLRTVLIERYATGGQAGTSSRIENYLGFPSGLSGDELAGRAHAQAERFGAELVVGCDAARIEPGEARHRIAFEDGTSLHAHAIILATGVSYRKLDVPGIDRFLGAGLYYGAARTEAQAMAGRDIVLVGGGNSAGQAAMFFASYARCVTILIRGASLAASMSQYLIDELATKENVRIRANGVIVEAFGDGRLAAIDVRDTMSGAVERREIDAVFVFIGADAMTGWLPKAVICDARGYICTGRDVVDLAAGHDWRHERDPFLLETSVPGIFAAGDVRHGSIKRVAAGVGEGSMAIAFVHQYLAELKPVLAAVT